MFYPIFCNLLITKLCFTAQNCTFFTYLLENKKNLFYLCTLYFFFFEKTPEKETIIGINKTLRYEKILTCDVRLSSDIRAGLGTKPNH